MSIADKMAFVAEVTSKLPPEALKTSDAQHAYSEENVLCVGLGVFVAADRVEFEHIGGFYATGYRSELRKGLYHGKGNIPNKEWRREIRRLYHRPSLRKLRSFRLHGKRCKEMHDSVPKQNNAMQDDDPCIL